MPATDKTNTHLLPILSSLGVLFFLGAVLFGVVLQTFGPGGSTELRSDASVDVSETFIAPAKPSNETVIENQTVAAKLDLQRKVIQTSGNTTEITAAIIEAGGEVISESEDQVVAKFPKENADSLEENIEAAGGRAETDYPVFVTADVPDWGVDRIDADEVWETTQAAGVRIGVVDTGVDYTHAELAQRYAGGFDFVNEDSDPQDDNGHGTHVAGIAVSSLNGSGIAGAAPGSALIGLKSLDADGTGYISDIIRAVDWAIANDVSILNFSLGTTYDSTLLEDALNRAAREGIVSVAAAGNTNGGALLYPAAYDSVIAVSATDQNDKFASFSSIGAELAAPGVSITSTLPGGQLGSLSGTSMASPHVAATVALMLSEGVTDVRTQLRDSALDLGPSGRDNYYGYGLIQSREAVLGADSQAPIVTFISPNSDTELNGSVSIEVSIQDEYEITDARLLINGEVVTTWESEPYSYTWNTAGLEPGSYSVVVEATDDSDNTGRAKLEFTIKENSVFNEPAPSSASGVTDNAQQRLQESNANEEALRRVPLNPGRSGESVQNRQQQGDRIPFETNKDQRNPQPRDDEEVDSESVQSSTTSNDSINSNSSKGQGSRNTDLPAAASENRGRGAVKGAQTEITWWQAILGAIF